MGVLESIAHSTSKHEVKVSVQLGHIIFLSRAKLMSVIYPSNYKDYMVNRRHAVWLHMVLDENDIITERWKRGGPHGKVDIVVKTAKFLSKIDLLA